MIASFFRDTDKVVKKHRMRTTCIDLLKKRTCAEQADQANHDQVNSNNEVKQARHQQDQDASYEGNQRGKRKVQIHESSLIKFMHRMCMSS
jgi:hypothetical protein